MTARYEGAIVRVDRGNLFQKIFPEIDIPAGSTNIVGIAAVKSRVVADDVPIHSDHNHGVRCHKPADLRHRVLAVIVVLQSVSIAVAMQPPQPCDSNLQSAPRGRDRSTCNTAGYLPAPSCTSRSRVPRSSANPPWFCPPTAAVSTHLNRDTAGPTFHLLRQRSGLRLHATESESEDADHARRQESSQLPRKRRLQRFDSIDTVAGRKFEGKHFCFLLIQQVPRVPT